MGNQRNRAQKGDHIFMLLLSALHRFYPNVINNLYAILELEILLGSKNNTETVIDNLGHKDLMIIDWR